MGMGLFAAVLLVINAVLVATILFVIVSISNQSKRIARMAAEAHDLAEKAEKHTAMHDIEEHPAEGGKTDPS